MTTKAPLLDKTLNQFQCWALQHPHKKRSRVLLPLISFIEGIKANNPTYLDQKRRLFGPNFCCAGQVVLGDFETLCLALTSPQGRTWRLGTSILEAAHAPNLDVGGRNLFLLSLSDQEAGGTGNHEAFRHCMQHYLLNDQAKIRQKDAIAQSLLNQLAEDYQTLYQDKDQAFFTNDQTGWMAFLVKYIHYVLFGLDPNNSAIVSTLTSLYYTHKGTLHYFAVGGKLLSLVNRFKGVSIPDLIEKVATIYEQSPALSDFTPSEEYGGMTRRELAKLTTAIMSIAALQGPLHLGYTALGYRPLPAYTGQKTAEILVKDHWDSLNLSDRLAIQRYLLECARLWAPVSATHRVATEPFVAEIAGKESQFPAGTPILIPMILGLLNEQFWGETTYEFNAERENLCPFHMGFHSVGDRSAGRICPGKDIAMEMLTDVLIAVGEVRRRLI